MSKGRDSHVRLLQRDVQIARSQTFHNIFFQTHRRQSDFSI